MMLIDNKFNIEQIVFLKTDVEQKKRVVIGINIRKEVILYQISCGTETSDHYEFEISQDVDVLATFQK